MKFLIPARRNSKGLPFKNRILLDKTLQSIPDDLRKDVYISTDDEHIIEKVKNTNINIHYRTPISATDDASTKFLVQEFISTFNLKNETIVMLYLTYPERTFLDIQEALIFYDKNSSKSLLCKQELKVHPYLCLLEGENNKGKQLIRHNLYRRQDYPKCFELSHYISIFNTEEVKKLNNNMYNEETDFFQIRKVVDVDTEEDLKESI